MFLLTTVSLEPGIVISGTQQVVNKQMLKKKYHDIYPLVGMILLLKVDLPKSRLRKVKAKLFWFLFF